MESSIILKRNIIFNPEGEKSINERRLFLGNPTNITEINNIKYDWAYTMYKIMGFTNFWIPEEIPMHDDKLQYDRELTEHEKYVFEKIIGFLIVLDSYQTNILKEFSRYITAPEVILALTSHEFQEALHSYSYQYILESIVNPVKADEIYNYWRQDELLKERIITIAKIYNDFIEKPTIENFIKAIFGNYILESIYFYSSFAILYTLGRQGKLRNTVQQIKYINRDEETHITLFKNIILTLKDENKEIFTDKEIEKWIYELFKYASDSEIKWAKSLIKNQILGLTDKVIELYIKWLTNKRLARLNLKPLYHNIDKNPLEWIDKYKAINNTKTDFFQAKPQTYTKRNELKWDE